MRFEDKEEKLPFKVEIRKKNSSQQNNINTNQQHNKHKKQEVKTQEIRSHLDSLKKTLENNPNHNRNYVNPLMGVFQKNLEEAEKKKIADEERKKEQLISKRLYEEYKKRQEHQRQLVKNSYYNNQNKTLDNRRSLVAPRFSTQKQQQDSSSNTAFNRDSSSNTAFNRFNGPQSGQNSGQNIYNNTQRFYQGRGTDTGTGTRASTGTTYRPMQRPPFAVGQNNLGAGKNLRVNVFSSGMAKQQMNSPIVNNTTPRKKFVEHREKKNNKPLKEKQNTNFDWRKYLDSDEAQSSNGQKYTKKSKNIQKNKNKKHTSIVLQSSVSLTSLSKLTSIPIDDFIASAKILGVKLFNLQEILDNDLVCLILEMHNCSCSFYGADEEFKEFIKVDVENCRENRPPVVCVLGHVDHGKTSLLDSIKKTKIVEMEAGGITQNISLYQLEQYGNTIFIDTPGHSVFTTMRKVGIKLTDIIILIIAADDGMQDQTREIIEVLKHYNKKIIICITKVDKMEGNFSPTMIYNELSTKYEIVPQEYGGEVPVIKVSNRTGAGIKDLLQVIEETGKNMKENLTCDNERTAIGIVVNSYLEQGFGVISYILLKHGTLKVGDEFISGKTKGKVRFLFVPKGVKQCNSSNIIKVVGFVNMPIAGDDFVVINNESLREDIFNLRNKVLNIDANNGPPCLRTLTKKKISILLKADTAASLESLSEALKALSNKQTNITIFSSNVGAVNSMDITKAKEFELVIVGFNVKIEKDKESDVKIISNNIIYHILDQVGDLTKRQEIVIKEEECGTGEIIEIFTFEKIVIGGCKVTSGSIFHGEDYICEIFRNKKSIFKGKINSMKRTNNRTKEAKNGTEVGIIFENFTDLKIQDEVKCYRVVKETIVLQD